MDNLARISENRRTPEPRGKSSTVGGPDSEVRNRLRRDMAFKGGVLALSLVAVVPLILILAFVIIRGASSINWQFLTELPKPMGETGGGISNAIVGTMILIVVASVVSIPLGVIAGIFLSESGKSGVGKISRISVETLMGIPSIVIGIVAYVWVVRPMGHFSALSGGVALADDHAARDHPLHGGDAAPDPHEPSGGSPRPRCLLPAHDPQGHPPGGDERHPHRRPPRRVPEPPGRRRRFSSPHSGARTWSANIFKPMASLPQTIFYYATSPYPEWQALAWGAVLRSPGHRARPEHRDKAGNIEMEDPVLSPEKIILETRALTAGFDGKDVVKGISLAVPERKDHRHHGTVGLRKDHIHAVHQPDARAGCQRPGHGEVLLDGEDVYHAQPHPRCGGASAWSSRDRTRFRR